MNRESFAATQTSQPTNPADPHHDYQLSAPIDTTDTFAPKETLESQWSSSPLKDIASLAVRTRMELQAMHDLALMEDALLDSPMVSPDNPAPRAPTVKQPMEFRSESTQRPFVKEKRGDVTVELKPEDVSVETYNPETFAKDKLAAAQHEVKNQTKEEQQESARLLALQRENERLKSELGAFDSEFFEQLEDLKYRYSRLQEIVGESPPVPPPSSSSGVKQTGLPLDRLGWAARNAMTAMDRAGLTSPLVSRPRHPHAYTYAPGGAARLGKTGIAELKSATGGYAHLGGVLSASQEAKKAYETSEFKGEDLLLREITANPTLLRHPGNIQTHLGGTRFGDTRMGGTHGIGSGTHSVVPNEIGGTFANLCERRLAFELSNHPTPEQATRTLIHRVMDVAARKGDGTFITVPQLCDVTASVGLKLSPEEIEILATGFASDGKGGVNAVEFSEMVRTLLFNLAGEHAARAAEVTARVNAGESQQVEHDQIDRLLREICEGILAHDRRAVIGTSTNLYKTLLKPFVERDEGGTGSLSFELFCVVIKELGALLTYQDLVVLARRYQVHESSGNPASSYPSSNLNHIQSFRDTQLRGSLSGAAKSNSVFGDWLSDTGVGLEDHRARLDSALVEYPRFVTHLTEVMELLIQQKGGVELNSSRYPWVLKEFEFVDALIAQLEQMKPSARRRVLMALQYALSAADPKQEGELDGFAVLNALLGAGFKLLRVNRVRLLRAVEELGGKMDYRDLCRVLLNSCADWTSEERKVVRRILAAMGVTVLERRAWLARLRQLLMEASARTARRAGRSWLASSAKAESMLDPSQDVGDVSSGGIPPASFLHCLRDCGVVLDVDEEATLLDCLDTERLSKMGEIEISNQQRSLMAETGGGTAARGQHPEGWSIPLIQYESFLEFCARHCGHWTDAAPDMQEALRTAVRGVASPVLAVHEFASLLQAFDEHSEGHVSKRAFLICAHRSRLLTRLSDEMIEALAEILTIDGGGKVRYTGFVVHLRALSSNLNSDPHAPTIIGQLIKNATDDRGTLLPLRNWLVRNTDMETFILTPRDLNALLREFSVLYRPEDLEALQLDIGRHVELKSDSMMGSNWQRELAADSGSQQQAMKKHVVDSRDLMAHLLQQRPHWTTIHPYLSKRMLKAMKMSGADRFADYDFGADDTRTSKENTLYDRHGSTRPGGPRGIESATARHILSRLRAFSGGGSEYEHWDVPHPGQAKDQRLFVDRDIFAQVTRMTGLALSDEDLILLADATDPFPEAKRVRCDVILEALIGPPVVAAPPEIAEGLPDEVVAMLPQMTGGNSRSIRLTEAAVFALEHLRKLIWNNGNRLQRSTLEWIADVRTVFAGFDKSGTGLISTEDFQLALNLLNSSVAPELLMDINYIPEGPGLIDYRDILRYALIPPNRAAESLAMKETHDSLTSRGDKVKTSSGSTKEKVRMKIKKKGFDADSPVKILLNVVRKSLQQFIVSDRTLEEAWVHLLRVFLRFDPNETNLISPRDFCMAVSLLIDGDDVVLTKPEWMEIIDYFSTIPRADEENEMNRARTVDVLGGVQVDYMYFCETVLDSNEIQQRMYEMRMHGSKYNLEKSKQHLSSATPKEKNLRKTDSEASLSRNLSNSRITTTNARNKRGITSSSVEYGGISPPFAIEGSSVGTPRSRSASTIGRRIQTTEGTSQKKYQTQRIAPKEDKILHKFVEASDRNKTTSFQSRLEAAVQKTKQISPNVNTSSSYGTSRTQGQVSRDGVKARRGSPGRSGNMGSSLKSAYASSHQTRGSGNVRFNWTDTSL